MKILIATLSISIILEMLASLIFQFTEIVLLFLLRIKQVLAYLIAIQICILPLFIQTEQRWVLIALTTCFAIYFFAKSYLARDDYYAWRDMVDSEIQAEQEEENEQK